MFAGSANCPTSPDGWGPYTEALFAVDIDTGEPVWSFQPHPPNNDDSDFAGVPVLFTANGQDLVGLGNKDAVFYVVSRDTGELVWSTRATNDNVIRPNFSSGGFIGPAAYADGIIAGGTGVADCPCMHAFDAATGDIVWQQQAVGPTYSPTTEVNGVVFVGSLDFTLRALRLDNGEVLWSDELTGLISGGVAIVGDDMWAVAGFREPGSPGPVGNLRGVPLHRRSRRGGRRANRPHRRARARSGPGPPGGGVGPLHRRPLRRRLRLQDPAAGHRPPAHPVDPNRSLRAHRHLQRTGRPRRLAPGGQRRRRRRRIGLRRYWCPSATTAPRAATCACSKTPAAASPAPCPAPAPPTTASACWPSTTPP